jgi:SAM-dependent methyltransferase
LNQCNVGSWGPVATEQPLGHELVERFYVDLLDRLAEARLPAAALPAMHEFYDRFQGQRAYFLHHFGDFVPSADRVFAVRRELPHLLDLGCGVGTQAHLFALRGARVTGLDFDAQRIAGAQAMTAWFCEQANVGELPVQFHAVDAFDYLGAQPEAAFDGCYTQFALAYMRPYADILAAIDRVIRPGGRIFLREFNAGSLYNRWRTRVDWLDDVAYQEIVSRFGWQLEHRRFHWLFPRQLIRGRSLRRPLGLVEQAVTRPALVGRNLAAAMTLVFRKRTDR